MPSLHRTLVASLPIAGAIAMGAACAQSCSGGGSRWVPAGTMVEARTNHWPLLLPDGRVLVTGGSVGGKPSATAEVWDPRTSSWTATGSMAAARAEGFITLLLADGRAMAIGGLEAAGAPPLRAVEIWDPTSGRWTPTGSLGTARAYHIAVLLEDGRVLVTGGNDGAAATGSAEIWDPAGGEWRATGALHQPRFGHGGTRIADGGVVVAGGCTGRPGETRPERWDKASGEWTLVASAAPSAECARACPGSPGQLELLTGACTNPGLAPLEIAQLAGDSGETRRLPPVEAPRHVTNTALRGGEILLVGGSMDVKDEGSLFERLFADEVVASVYEVHLDSTYRYDAASARWRTEARMSAPRSLHRAVALADGSVLIMGGVGPRGPARDAERWIAGPR